MKNSFTRLQRIILWLACSAIFFEAFDVSIVNLALPVMAMDLGMPLASAQWIQTIYLLSFGGFLLLGGRLCDHLGSKNLFMAGMFLFGAASALALFSHHILALLPARAAQGIGAALAMPGGISLLARHFAEGDERQRAIGIFGSFAAVGFAGGLALGGIITSFFSWHWIFGLNVPIITGVLIAGYLFIPEDGHHRGVRLNGLTACWLTGTLLLFCYGVHELTALGWLVIPCLLTALVSAALLWRYDSRQERPFFGPGIFASSPEARKSLGASLILGAGFLSFVFICTISLAELMRLDIRATGLLLFPYSIGSAFVSRFFLPWLFRRMRVVQVGALAMALLLAGVLLLMTGVCTLRFLPFLLALLLVNSVCIAIGYPAFTILALSGVPPAHQGIAAGLQSAIYSVGTGIGLSLTGLCLQLFSGHPPATQLLAACAMLAALCLVALFLLLGAGRKRSGELTRADV